MINQSLRLSLVVLLGVFILACRTLAPVYNVEGQVFFTSLNKTPTMDEVKAAITQAGASKGWTMKPAGEGHLVATLFSRQHMAQVDIKYNTKSYSITYKDSQGLKYDGSAIHPGYNRWVQNLQRIIDARISAL